MKNCIIWVLTIFLCPLFMGCSGIRPPSRPPDIQVRMETTGYCSCGSCCSWKRNWMGRPVVSAGPDKGRPKRVGVTASGTRVHPGVIAADTRVYPFGTIMHVPGYGMGVVEDIGGDIKGQHIDLYYRTHRQALKWGRVHRDVKVWYPHPRP